MSEVGTMRVLVVEDERKVASFLRQLAEEGYAVEVAPDGATAMDLIVEGPPFDPIVLDLMLPRVDGFALLKAARAHAVPTPVLRRTT